MTEQLQLSKKYENTPYLTLLEIASSETDVKKRKQLFEYADTVLKREFKKAIKEEEEKGFSI